MSEPTTVTGIGLASFLRGLIPESDAWSAQMAHVEAEAATAERRRLRLAVAALPLHGFWLVGNPDDGTRFVDRDAVLALLDTDD